ncbi:hypothetical protein C8R47DRAFT_218539 [Mycena vitilis]|nr:hypothetical protein C8R47DRAFT_218539 [Mycena vitilis]
MSSQRREWIARHGRRSRVWVSSGEACGCGYRAGDVHTPRASMVLCGAFGAGLVYRETARSRFQRCACIAERDDVQRGGGDVLGASGGSVGKGRYCLYTSRARCCAGRRHTCWADEVRLRRAGWTPALCKRCPMRMCVCEGAFARVAGRCALPVRLARLRTTVRAELSQCAAGAFLHRLPPAKVKVPAQRIYVTLPALRPSWAVGRGRTQRWRLSRLIWRWCLVSCAGIDSSAPACTPCGRALGHRGDREIHRSRCICASVHCQLCVPGGVVGAS